MAEEQLAGIKAWLTVAVNITEEQFNMCLAIPQLRSMMEKMPVLMSHEIVAEVKSAKLCTACLKPGQKFVFDLMPAILNVQKSSAPLCAREIGSIAELAPVFWSEVAAGINSKPRTIGCPDTGLGKGGFGHVEFVVSLVKQKQ